MINELSCSNLNNAFTYSIPEKDFNLNTAVFISNCKRSKELSHLRKQAIKLRLREWHKKALNNLTKLPFRDSATALLVNGTESCLQVIFSVHHSLQEHALNVR